MQYEGFAAAATLCRVDARDDALPCGFLVARRAVDLSGEEQALDGLRFERMAQLGGREEVVLDGVARPLNPHVAEAGDAAQGGYLYVHRQRRRETVQVKFVGVETFRL